jgi:hypothetical protein
MSSRPIGSGRWAQMSAGTDDSDADDDNLDVDFSSDEISNSDDILTNTRPAKPPEHVAAESKRIPVGPSAHECCPMPLSNGRLGRKASV